MSHNIEQGKLNNSEAYCKRTVALCSTDPTCAELLKFWERYPIPQTYIEESREHYFFRKNKIVLSWIKFNPEIKIKERKH